MGNLLEKRNQFRLYDVDGEVLTSAGDHILIREPVGFNQIPITLERDKETHGVFFEFGDENQPLGFDRPMFIDGEDEDPYTLIQTIVNDVGVDGKLQFEFLNWNGSTYVSQYLADLDLETVSIVDFVIKVNTRRVMLGDLFRTRLETPVNFGATTSIDGTTITGLTAESMFLHGKLIKENSILEFDEELTWAVPETEPLEDLLALTTFTVRQDGNTFENGDKPAIGDTGVSLGAAAKVFPVRIGGYYLLNFPSKKDYTANFTVSMSGSISAVSGATVRLRFRRRVRTFDPVGETQTTIYDSTTNSGDTTNFDFTETFSITKTTSEVGQTDVSILIFRENSGAGEIDGDGTLIIDEGSFFNMERNTVAENSHADTYNTFDSVNHVLEVINNDTNLLESAFLETTMAGIYLTNGYKIRDFANRNVITNFKTLFGWLQASFGLGYAIYDDGGSFKVLMERYSEFYQDDEIDYIEDIEDGSFEISIDKDLIFNEIKVGYKDFPKSTDENKSNNLDEVNTEHVYLTPIESVKKKKDYVSDVIASGYKIENQRREQFKDIPVETVSDDTKIFCINGINNDSYTDLSMSFSSVLLIYNIIIEGAFFDVSVGDEITISGTVSNNKTFTIEEISFIPGSDLGIITNLLVTEATVLELNVTGVTMTLESDILRALRDEEFVTLTDVISPETSYNIGLNPTYMLFNQSPLINSGFNPKAGTEELKAQEVKLNEDMTCRFASGEGGYILDPDRETITMDDDLTLNQLNNYGRLFTGKLIKFTASIDYDRVLTIRNACLNEAVSDNFGYIRVNNGTTDYKGFIMSMTYNPQSEKVDFTLREQYV